MILNPGVPRHARKKRKDHQVSCGREEHQKTEKDDKPFTKKGTNSDRRDPKEKTGEKKSHPVGRSAARDVTFGIWGQRAPMHPKVDLPPRGAAADVTEAVEQLMENNRQDERSREGHGPDRTGWKRDLRKPPDQKIGAESTDGDRKQKRAASELRFDRRQDRNAFAGLWRTGRLCVSPHRWGGEAETTGIVGTRGIFRHCEPT
jgi:hypothetical protein